MDRAWTKDGPDFEAFIKNAKTKPLAEMTLKEVKEMCKKTMCRDHITRCPFVKIITNDDIGFVCKLVHNIVPKSWELDNEGK